MSQNGNNVLVALSNAMAEAVERAGAATLLIDARRRLPASGIAYSPDLVLTADHVLERDDDIRIALPNGDSVNARLAGRDPGSDLALLRLEKEILTVAETTPEKARVGQFALALGRPSLEGIQASLGIISAIGGAVRTGRGGLLEQYLRTDAIPYPGFSGGPLVDSSGKVIGLNTSGLTRGGSLTIPAGLAWRVAAILAEHGHVRRGFLGVRSQPVRISQAQQQALGRSQSTGLLLVGVEQGSPAEEGGLLVGDILVKLNEKVIDDPDELLSALVGSIVGEASSIEVLRGGNPTQLKVTIGERR
jgi:S1-C subfamily serine protease